MRQTLKNDLQRGSVSSSRKHRKSEYIKALVLQGKLKMNTIFRLVALVYKFKPIG